MWRNLTFFEKVVWVLTLGSAFALLLAYLAPFVPAYSLSWPAPLGLVFVPLVLAQAFFLALWTFKVKKQAFLPLAVLLLGLPLHARLYGFKKETVANPAVPTWKAMTFNVRVFNRYDWISGMDVPAAIKELVANEAPDVLCVQEFFLPKAPDLGFKNRFFIPTTGSRNYGLALYTNHPIVQKGERMMTRHEGLLVNRFQWADLVMGEDTVRIINAHLASIRLGGPEYELLRNPESQDDGAVTRGLKNILRRFLRASAYRAQQTDEIMAFARQSPYPVVMCVDMNDTPTSYAYQSIHTVLPDAFTAAGSGFGATLVSSPYPLRIDHIFADPAWQPIEHRVLSQVLSDHRAVTAVFQKSIPPADPAN